MGFGLGVRMSLISTLFAEAGVGGGIEIEGGPGSRVERARPGAEAEACEVVGARGRESVGVACSGEWWGWGCRRDVPVAARLSRLRLLGCDDISEREISLLLLLNQVIEMRCCWYKKQKVKMFRKEKILL